MKSDNVLSREKEKCPNIIKIYYTKIIIFGGNKNDRCYHKTTQCKIKRHSRK